MVVILAQKKRTAKITPGFGGLGGNSFGDDVDRGLGKTSQTPNWNESTGGYSGLGSFGGSNFQDDISQGLGKTGPVNEPQQRPQSFNQDFGGLGGNSFGDDVDKGLGKTPPPQKKKAGPKNILDEWNDAAGGGW